MEYVNKIVRPAISTNEVIPYNITVSDIPTSPDTNVITSALRFDTSNPVDTGVDISTKIAKSTNVLQVQNIWLGSETPKEGTYRIRILFSTANSSTKAEVNIEQVVYRA